jgi:hypothetical protein
LAAGRAFSLHFLVIFYREEIFLGWGPSKLYGFLDVSTTKPTASGIRINLTRG